MEDILKNKLFVFIIGAPRSGTTWLHEILSYHYDIASIAPVEQTVFGNYLPDLISTWEKQKFAIDNNQWKQGLPVVWSQAEFDAFITYFIDKVYLKINERNPICKVIIDKQPNYSNHLFLIKKYLPNSKFIQIIRDGRNVASSSKKAFEKKGFMHKEVEVIAEKWMRYNKNIDNFKAHYPNDVLEFRYEDLMDNKQTSTLLGKAFYHCNIESSNEIVDFCLEKHNMAMNVSGENNNLVSKNKHNNQKKWESELSIKEKYLFNIYAGEYLIEKGYAKDNSWMAQSFLDKLRIFFIKFMYKIKIK